MFQIITDGLVVSRHETRAEAESAMATIRAETLAEVERFLDDIHTAKEFAAGLTIETT